MNDKQRRNFIKKTALGAIAIHLPFNNNVFAANILGANNTLNIGVIGCNGMGWSNTLSILKNKDVRLIAICDVDNNVIERRKEEMKKKSYTDIKTYTDYRELLDQKEIDAVIIGTPDHWHCKMMVDACEAGKQVYVENPVANTGFST